MELILFAVLVIVAALGSGVVARRSVLGKRMEHTFETLKSPEGAVTRETATREGALSLRDRTRKVGSFPASATASGALSYQAPARKAS
jgi:hypothetical protein